MTHFEFFSALTNASENLSSLRHMLSRRRHTAARVGLTAAGYIALLSRLPVDYPVYVSASDLDALVAAGDERGE